MVDKAREFMRRWGGWLVPIGISLAIVAWGVLLFAVEGNHPRQWSYTNLPDVPAVSYFSSERPQGAAPGQQVEPTPRVPGGM